jgi:hypothetical protein
MSPYVVLFRHLLTCYRSERKMTGRPLFNPGENTTSRGEPSSPPIRYDDPISALETRALYSPLPFPESGNLGPASPLWALTLTVLTSEYVSSRLAVIHNHSNYAHRSDRFRNAPPLAIFKSASRPTEVAYGTPGLTVIFQSRDAWSSPSEARTTPQV